MSVFNFDLANSEIRCQNVSLNHTYEIKLEKAPTYSSVSPLIVPHFVVNVLFPQCRNVDRENTD